MRSFCIAAIAASLLFTSLASAQPLVPGKPAGVHQARRGASTGLLIAGGALVAGLVAVVAFSGSDNNKGVVTAGVSTGTTS